MFGIPTSSCRSTRLGRVCYLDLSASSYLSRTLSVSWMTRVGEMGAQAKKAFQPSSFVVVPLASISPSHHLDPKSSTGLVAEVKRKFRQLIEVWEFYKGVIPGLRQWKDILRSTKESDQWRPLVMNHVLPSMSRYARAQFQVDPLDQESYLEVITGEFQWLDLISPTMIGEVMAAEVFPMWHEALYRLLTAENVDYDAVVQWYSWWVEEVFPEDLKSLPFRCCGIRERHRDDQRSTGSWRSCADGSRATTKRTSLPTGQGIASRAPPQAAPPPSSS